MIVWILILVIIIALIFEYINGFHDAANAIATVVSTKVLTPKQAVAYGAVFEILGAFMGTHVAKTIGSGIIESSCVDQYVILCALLGAITWNIFTWYFGIPSSSSHALIGGLIGASIIKAGIPVLKIDGIIEKVLIPMVTSPFVGFVVGFVVMLVLMWLFYKARPERINKHFKKLQLISSAIMAFSHGSNDAQKTMGIITLSLVTFYGLKTFIVPWWVILMCAITMGLGTMSGGWRIIRTMGSKVLTLKPIHGFAAETSAAAVILTCSHFGIPISTTHVISCSIMGVGSTKRFSAVRWGIVGRIISAWVFTIPICIILAGIFYFLLEQIIH